MMHDLAKVLTDEEQHQKTGGHADEKGNTFWSGKQIKKSIGDDPGDGSGE
jgi:hypothetical protein